MYWQLSLLRFSDMVGSRGACNARVVRLQRAVERTMARCDTCKRLSEKHEQKFEALRERPQAHYAAARLKICAELKYHCTVVQSMAVQLEVLACAELPQHMHDLNMAHADYKCAIIELQLLRERGSLK